MFRRRVARTWAKLPQRALPELYTAASPRHCLHDPAHVHHKELIERWSMCVYREELSLDDLWCALGAAGRRLLKARSPWNCVSSPAGAFILTCVRLGWRILAPFAVETHTGLFCDLRMLSPKFMGVRALEASMAWTDRSVAGQFWWQPVHRAVQASKTPLCKYCIPLAAAGGAWTQEALHRRSLACHDRCLLCDGPGTQLHRAFHCPAWDVARRVFLGDTLDWVNTCGLE
eukprot:1504485-Amphidinium_carterae.1